jgi:N-acyl-D-amino-acid deacylase
MSDAAMGARAGERSENVEGLSRTATAPAPRHGRPSGQTRREFLCAAGAGLSLLASAGAGGAQKAGGEAKDGRPPVTGLPDSRTAAYDELMAAFIREHQPPGASLAVARAGRLVYARGFGYADVEAKEPVQPESRFRIASLSKPITSVSVFQLIERKKLRLDDKVFSLLKLKPYLRPGQSVDPRIYQVTVRHCLQHTGGWDRGKGFDPMGAPAAEEVARALGVPLPVGPEQIIRYTMGRPLDSEPGTAYAYSNFGYCVLGRVIEAASGKKYGDYVKSDVLAPLGIKRMRLAKNLLEDRAPGEVRYYDSRRRTGRAVSGPRIGAEVPLPYGVECLESMDANGGWLASAVDLVRFAAGLDDPGRCRILREEGVRAMLAPPPGAPGQGPDGRPKPNYYACGWDTRPDPQRGRYTKWHLGALAGSSTLLVCRSDGIDWAALFNGDTGPDGKAFAAEIDPLLHGPADRIRVWPARNLFEKYL